MPREMVRQIPNNPVVSEATPLLASPAQRGGGASTKYVQDERDDHLQRLHSFNSNATLDFEATAILAEVARAKTNTTSATTTAAPVEPTPLPLKTMFVLSIVIFSEPMSMTILFPFLFFMVRDFGIEENNVGYYVGFIASSFSLAQFVTAMGWGWISDKIGRRPVLLTGLLGNTITILMFGQSHTLWWAILSRALCGFLNANIGVAKSTVGEITNDTNQAKGFSIIGFMWAIGMIVGPVVGGLLSNPATTYPDVFGNVPFLVANPYFLPCLVSACISFTGFIAGFFFLKETRQLVNPEDASDRVENDMDSEWEQEQVAQEQQGSLKNGTTAARSVERRVSFHDQIVILGNDYEDVDDAENEGQSSQRASVVTITDEESNSGTLRTSNEQTSHEQGIGLAAAMVILAYGMIALPDIIFEEVFSLWCVTQPRDGGLGFSSANIGVFLSIMGCVMLFFQLFAYPFCSRFFSVIDLYRAGVFCYSICYLGFPAISTFLAASDSEFLRSLVWPALFLNMSLRLSAEVLGFTSVMILIKDSAHKSNLGFVNGMAQTLVSLVRGAGPAIGGILWAWGLTNGRPFPFNYWFVFEVITILALGSLVQSRFVSQSSNLSSAKRGEVVNCH